MFKTILLLDAVTKGNKSKVESQGGNSKLELLYPTEQNIELAFSGTDWNKGKARAIAAGLCKDGFIFETPGQNRVKQYTAANRSGDNSKIEELKKKAREDAKMYDLITLADLMLGVKLSANIEKRFVMKGTDSSHFTSDSNKLQAQKIRNRFGVIVTFALNDNEKSAVHNSIMKTISQLSCELLFVESLVPMDADLLDEYVDNMAYSKYYSQSDKQQARHYESLANQNLTTWRQRISNGAFIIYTPENKSGIRVPNLPALQDELARINHNVYYYGLEQFSLIDNMFAKGPLAQGAGCGISEELSGTFKSTNIKTSLSEALKGAWKVPNYWEDPTKKSLPIVKIKQKVDSIIVEGFAKPSGRISILSIYEALEEAPFGFMPTNVTAFVMGFVLKEYANNNYFWSNGSLTDSMTPEHMKKMIAEAINQTVTPSNKYNSRLQNAINSHKQPTFFDFNN